jgi:hypothetical protein
VDVHGLQVKALHMVPGRAFFKRLDQRLGISLGPGTAVEN